LLKLKLGRQLRHVRLGERLLTAAVQLFLQPSLQFLLLPLRLLELLQQLRLLLLDEELKGNGPSASVTGSHGSQTAKWTAEPRGALTASKGSCELQ
jgi:hypothetical protein